MFGAPSLDFLGHHVSSQGIQSLEIKVQAIRSFPQPTSQRKLREFIGMVNFYHWFLPSCASILQPLNELLTHPRDKSTPLTWTEEALSAFNRTKEVLAEATLFAHPKPDVPNLSHDRCFLLCCWFSSSAMGQKLMAPYRILL